MLAKIYSAKNFLGRKFLYWIKNNIRYQRAISDLSGCDIKKHNDNVNEAIKSVRDWLVNVDLERSRSGKRTISGNAIWAQYNDFQAYLYDQVVVTDQHPSVDHVQITEIQYHMKNWCKKAYN